MRWRLLAINPVDHPGGAETTLMRLLNGLKQHGWSVAVTTPGPGPLQEEALSSGIDWEPLPLGGIGAGQGARAAISWPRARALAGEADTVLLNGAVCGRLLPGLVPSRRQRVSSRVALHVHDMVVRVPRFWRLADVVLAASGAVARRLEGLNARVVYPPVDPDPPECPAPWPEAPGPVIGFVGRLEPRKGSLDLALAAPEIRRRAPGARVVLIGDEPYGLAPEYTQAVLAAPGIEHHRWVDNAPGLMRHLDVLVLPAYREPFGTVLAEAMAVGTPVVASAVDGLPEVVQDGVSGRLVGPGDPSALADAVLDVLEHRTEMSAAARLSAVRFHTERHLAEMESVLTA